MSPEIKWLAVSVASVWLLALCVPGVRNSYANGWRCLLRHASLWKVPAGFALAYGSFQLAGFFLLSWRIGRFPETNPLVSGIASDARQSALAAILPASESLAGALNCLVATFPISILCALLFFANYRGLAAELVRSLLRRFRFWGWVMILGLAATALASMAKPLTLLALPEIAQILSLQELLVVTGTVNALSFVFEYLLGTCVQVYLLLIAYGWVRGLNFQRARVLHFAVRRMGFVLKWSLAMIAATLFLIHAPLFIEAWITGDPASPRTFGLSGTVSQPLLAVVMIGLATVQIRLAFHNDSLRGAIVAHFQFLRRHGLTCLLFLLAAFSIFFLQQMALRAGDTWLGVPLWRHAWALVVELVSAMSGGWILAAWVCFYKQCEEGSQSIAF